MLTVRYLRPCFVHNLIWKQNTPCNEEKSFNGFQHKCTSTLYLASIAFTENPHTDLTPTSKQKSKQNPQADLTQTSKQNTIENKILRLLLH